jgi:hypothetical protein
MVTVLVLFWHRQKTGWLACTMDDFLPKNPSANQPEPPQSLQSANEHGQRSFRIQLICPAGAGKTAGREGHHDNGDNHNHSKRKEQTL